MQVLDVVKTLLHAFALFQELVKSLLTKKMLKSTSHTLTFVWVINQPFAVTSTVGSYDVFVNVVGGGYAGQAGAIRHGIARALLQVDPDFRDSLKRAGLLTRDSRKVERKKPGLKKARKASQFSKR